MTKFRFHRGGLAESMATITDVASSDTLVRMILERMATDLFVGFNGSHLRTTAYLLSPDKRIGWAETYAVQIRGFIDIPDDWTVVGFSDGPIAGISHMPTGSEVV